MKEINLPDWTKNLPDHTVMASKDIYPILGYKSGSALYHAATCGILPMPDIEYRQSTRQYSFNSKKNKFAWTLGALRSHKIVIGEKRINVTEKANEYIKLNGMITQKQAFLLLGMSESKFFRVRKNDSTFPKKIMLSKRLVGYKHDELIEWQRQNKKETQKSLN